MPPAGWLCLQKGFVMHFPESFKAMLITVFLIFVLFLPVSNCLSAETAEGLTLQLKEGSKDDWDLRGPDGKILGSVESKSKETFKIYDAGGVYNGFVYQSGDWVPRDARQSRLLQVSSADVRLYIDIVTASQLNVPKPRRLVATRKAGTPNEWVLSDPGGVYAGYFSKEEVNFKFYDNNGKFMGYIDTADNWLPRLGISRREMKITPEQARFYLDVLTTIAAVK